ncbi:TPM domain-containing protein [uncultured Planococcus sp.]|uniref:TPM domain-containing protein n=1 Tax=uncultured Planococcus sp. TaxID=337815 RepID=UPI002636E5FF|nr:TPM domain-containing protein [uncultured Planococcus sp.]
MRNFQAKWLVTLCFLLIFMAIGGVSAFAAVDQRVYDNANLLSESEIAELEAVAAEHSSKHGTDFLFLTSEDPEAFDVVDYMGDFYDEWAVENGQENAVLLTMNIATRDVYLAGFGTAETTLDNQRVNLVLDRIIPEMQRGDYAGAFRETVTTASRYMEFRPGVNPENIFFKNWFQLAVALLLGGGIVGFMVYNSGGRVTTTASTYFDGDNSRVTGKLDQFRNKTISRRKVPKKSGGGGGFGGGSTGGGRSFSGGGRKF